MKAIYAPKGAAAEYAPFACNLYTGCGNGCRYCYAPACLHMSREEFAKPKPREGILEALRRDAAMIKPGKPVLLCFTCDPYQELDRTERLTHEAIRILGFAGHPIRILTKCGALAQRDLWLFSAFTTNTEVGVTLTFQDDTLTCQWEPHADPYENRVGLLREAHKRGLRTWVSMEPVIMPSESLAILRELAPQGVVDLWWLGRWNHDARANAIDWRTYLQEAEAILKANGCNYKVKKALQEAAKERGNGK